MINRWVPVRCKVLENREDKVVKNNAHAPFRTLGIPHCPLPHCPLCAAQEAGREIHKVGRAKITRIYNALKLQEKFKLYI